MDRLINRASTAALWSSLEIATRYGVQFLVMVVLARLLSPVDFGLIAMLLVFTSIGTLLVDSGFSAALVQRQHTTADDETTVFIFTVGASILTAGIVVLAAPAIGSFFHEPKLVDLTRVMALVLPLGALASVPDALLTMRLDFKTRARAEVIASLCSGTVAVVMALRGFGVWSLASQSIVSIAVRGFLLWIYSGWRPCGRYRGESFRSLFSFGGYMLLSGLLSTISTRIQAILIGKLFDARELGLYTLAQNAPQAPASFIGSILNRVGLPLFSNLAPDRSRLRLALSVSLRVSMFVFLPCMLGIALLARPLVDLMYGTKWSAAAPMLSLLALATALWPIHVLNLVALSAQGRTDLYFRLEILKNVTTVVVAVAASPFGPVMVAAAMLLASLCAAVINTWYSGKMLSYGLIKQLADQAKTMIAASVAALPAWSILHWAPLPKWSAISCATGTAFALYIGCSVALKQPALQEIRNMLRIILPARPSTTRNNTP